MQKMQNISYILIYLHSIHIDSILHINPIEKTALPAVAEEFRDTSPVQGERRQPQRGV